MATQPVVPRLPVCPSLLAQLRGEGADADDIAALLARDGDSILAGTSAFRRPTPASAAALTAHGFTHDGVGCDPPTKVVIGTSTEQLVRDLVPKLNLEEAQTYVMLRRAYASDALPASVDDACVLAVTRTYFAERAALLRCTSQLAALAASGDDAAAPAHDALAKLLDKGLADRVAEQLCEALERVSPPRPAQPDAASEQWEELWAQQHALEMEALAETSLVLSHTQRAVVPGPTHVGALLAAVASSPTTTPPVVFCALVTGMQLPALLARQSSSAAGHPLCGDDLAPVLAIEAALSAAHASDATTALAMVWAAWLTVAEAATHVRGMPEAVVARTRVQHSGFGALKKAVCDAAAVAPGQPGTVGALVTAACVAAGRAALGGLLAAFPLDRYHLLWHPDTRGGCVSMFTALCAAASGEVRDALWTGADGEGDAAVAAALRHLVQAASEAFPASPTDLLACLAASCGTSAGARATWHYLSSGEETLCALYAADVEPPSLEQGSGPSVVVTRTVVAPHRNWPLTVPPRCAGELRAGYLPPRPESSQEASEDAVLFQTPHMCAADLLLTRVAALLRTPRGLALSDAHGAELDASLRLLTSVASAGGAPVVAAMVTRRLTPAAVQNHHFVAGMGHDNILAALCAGIDAAAGSAGQLPSRLASVIATLAALGTYLPTPVAHALASSAVLGGGGGGGSGHLSACRLSLLDDIHTRVELRTGTCSITTAVGNLTAALATRGVVKFGMLSHVATTALPSVARSGDAAFGSAARTFSASKWAMHAACVAALDAVLRRSAPQSGVEAWLTTKANGQDPSRITACASAASARGALGGLFGADEAAVEGLVAPLRAVAVLGTQPCSGDLAASVAATVSVLPSLLAAVGGDGGVLGRTLVGGSSGTDDKGLLPVLCLLMRPPWRDATATSARAALLAVCDVAAPRVGLAPSLLVAASAADAKAGTAAARDAILAPLHGHVALLRHEDAVTACQLLRLAAHAHPALAEWLLFDVTPAAPPPAHGADAVSQDSGLDLLYELVTNAAVLRTHAPAVLHAALLTLCAVAAGSSALQAAASWLRGKPQVWATLLACVTVASDDDVTPSQPDEAARLGAASCALRLLLDGVLAQARTPGGAGESAAADAVRDWVLRGSLRAWLGTLCAARTSPSAAVTAARSACGSLVLRVAAKHVASRDAVAAALDMDASLVEEARLAAAVLLSSPVATAVLADEANMLPPCDAQARLLELVGEAWERVGEAGQEVTSRHGAGLASQATLRQLVDLATQAGVDGAALRAVPLPLPTDDAQPGVPRWDGQWIATACGAAAAPDDADGDAAMQPDSLSAAAAACGAAITAAVGAIQAAESHVAAVRITRAVLSAARLGGSPGSSLAEVQSCVETACGAVASAAGDVDVTQETAWVAAEEGQPALGVELAALLVALVRAYASVAGGGGAGDSGSRRSSVAVLSAVSATAAGALSSAVPRAADAAVLPKARQLAKHLCRAVLGGLGAVKSSGAHALPWPSSGLRHAAPAAVYTLCACTTVPDAADAAVAGLEMLLLMTSGAGSDGHVSDGTSDVATLVAQHLPPFAALMAASPDVVPRLACALARCPSGAPIAVSAGAPPALAQLVRAATSHAASGPATRGGEALRALGALLAGTPASPAIQPHLVPIALGVASDLGHLLPTLMAAPATTATDDVAGSACFFAAQLAVVAPGDWELAVPGHMRACRLSATSLLGAAAAAPGDGAQAMKDACLPASAFLLACARWRQPRGDDVAAWPTASTLRALRAQCLRREQPSGQGAGGGPDTASDALVTACDSLLAVPLGTAARLLPERHEREPSSHRLPAAWASGVPSHFPVCHSQMPAAPADATALLALSGRSGGPGSPSRHEAGTGPAGDEPSGTEVNGDSLAGDCRPSGGCGCPRCGSVDTKFCYFNNYNVKQPRFFCKSCQRYWTHGGTLRNVQPGAGRRKRTEGAPHLEEAPAGLASTGRPVSREGADTGSGTEPEDSGHQRSTRRRSLRTRRTPGVDGPATRAASAGDGATSCRGAASVGGGFAPVAQRQSRSQGGKGVSSAAVGGASQLQSNATSLWLIPPAFPGTHAAPASLPMEVYPRPDALPWAVAATMAALHQHSRGSAGPGPTIAHDALATPAQHPFLWSSIDPNTCAAAAAIWPYTRLAMQAQQPTATHSLATLAASSVCLAKPQPCSTAAPPSYLSALGLDALPLGKGLFSVPQPSLVANPAAFARSVLVQHQAAGQAAAASPDAAAATAAA